MEGDVLKTRMERYYSEEEEQARTKKNENLYEDIYNDLPSSSVATLNNESEIDITKLKGLTENREDYRRVKQYQSILKTDVLEETEEEYDIYEDIDNKIYDINTILEDAKAKRVTPERETYRSLKNTQYNILSKLDLNETNQEETEEMVTDFFTQDKTMKDLIKSLNRDEDEPIEETNENTAKTSADLFEELKGSENTILTEAVTADDVTPSEPLKQTETDTFYTNHLSFTKEDFEGFQNLQTTVKKNNKLIKILITVLTVILVVICFVLTFAIL